jgi:eukaryotic-like serine/threonine-protein kinase
MVNEQLDKYRLITLLATGGMGEVFLARHEGPGGFSKSVVIKRILRHLASDQGFIEMFKNEAKLAAQLQHPNIVQIFELGHDAGSDTWFIAMEFVHGRSLRSAIEHALVQHKRCPPRVAARLVADALHGLGFAHRLTDEAGRPLGLLHRDISPDNVLVAFSGQVKLVDFGIAKATVGARNVTRTGALKGKFSYMAPEQFVAGATLDPRTDLYAAGVLLHELLTNERPACVPKTAEDALAPRQPFTPREDLPPAMNDILRRALAPEREGRWESADAMAQALEAFVMSSGEPMGLAQVSRWVHELFGHEIAAANPAVAPVQSAPLSTAVLSGPVQLRPAGSASATAAFSTAPTVIEEAYKPAPRKSGARPALTPSPGQTLDSEEPTKLEDLERHDERVERTSGGHRVKPPSRWAWAATVGVSLLVGLLVGALVLLPALNLGSGVEPAADAGLARPAVAIANPVIIAALADAGPMAMPTIDLAALPVDAGDLARVDPTPTPDPTPDPVPDRPPKRRKPAPGKVSVRVAPWAEVIYNGKNYGPTPLPGPIECPPGLATFTLKNKQLGVTRTVKVKVISGQEVVLKADLFKK